MNELCSKFFFQNELISSLNLIAKISKKSKVQQIHQCRGSINFFLIANLSLERQIDSIFLYKIPSIYMNKKVIFLDHHHVWRSIDPTLDISSDFVKKRKKAFCLLFFLLHHFLLKKTQLFFCIQLSARVSAPLLAWLSTRLSAQLSAWFLMLPNLTNHYIKLSDGDFQCE